MSRADNVIWFWGRVGPYCRKCGYDVSHHALHLHHVDKSQKTKNNDTLAMWMGGSRKLIITKCMSARFMILCANCHAEVHAGVWRIPDNYPGDNIFTSEDLFECSPTGRFLTKILEAQGIC